MKKYKLIIQIEQIKKYLEQGQLKEACDLAKEVDPKKLKSMSDLSVIADCYFQNRRYAEAKELFEQIYDTVKTRRVLAQLVHLSIKLKDMIEANYYLEEFIKMAPDDFYQYIFRYNIDKLMRKPIHVLISDLERLKEVEYIESWAYELAKLYYKSGNEAACRRECEKIILWFGNGEYVDRAKALLAFYNGELDLEKLLDTTKQKSSKRTDTDTEESDNQTNEIEKNSKEEDSKDRCAEENDEITEIPEGKEYKKSDIKEVIQEEKKLEKIVKKYKEQIEYLQGGENKKEKVQPNMIIPPVFGKSKHTLFHKKYDMQENEAAIDSPKVEAENEETKGKDLHVVENIFEDEINTGPEDNGKNDLNIDSSVKHDLKNDIKKTRESLFHIPLETNDELIQDIHSKLLPLLEENKVLLSEIFGNFIRISGLKEDILHSLESMIHSVYGNQNLIIMGSKDSGKIKLAKKYAKLLHRLSFISSPKVALIDAKKLNQMDFISKSHQLKECIMILQNAQYLTRESLIRLMELQQVPNQNIIYLLTGITREMEELWEDKKELRNSYPNCIVLPEYKSEDYIGFAYDAILEAGYQIENEAFEYLSDVILDRIEIIRENALSEVFSYINQLILKHEKQNEQVLLELTRKGSLNQLDFSILKKEHIKG